MIKNRILYILLILISAIAFVVTNHRLALLFLICFPTAALCSLILLLIEKKNHVLHIEYPESCDVNKGFYLRFWMKRKWRIPMGRIQFDIQVENSLYQETRTINLSLEPENKTRTEYEMIFERQECGSFSLFFHRANMQDVFGIWQIVLTVPEEIYFLVYPQIPEIETVQLQRQSKSHEGQQYNPNRAGMDVTEVHDLRDYHKGDLLNSIHWKLSSKIDKLIVREFGNPLNQQVAILFDGAFLGYQENHQKVNAVFGMVAALSQAMIHGERTHSIWSVYNHEVYARQIENVQEMMNCITDLLESHLSRMKMDAIDLEQYKMTEQIILVTGYLDENCYNKLGEYTELTVILLTDADKEYLEEHAYFKILAIPVSHLEERVHQIEI